LGLIVLAMATDAAESNTLAGERARDEGRLAASDNAIAIVGKGGHGRDLLRLGSEPGG
jgi:hypothetical protein